MIRNYKKSFYLIFIILFVYIGIRFSNIDKNEKLLNYLASNYFDEEYYLTNYPEISNIDISPFEHYINQGWREGKNPNKVFNTNFYKNLYLLKQNKHNLNPLTDYVRAKVLFFKRYTNPDQLKKA